MSKTSKLTSEQQQDIIDKYIKEELSCPKIAKEYKMSTEGIRALLQRHGIKIRPMTENARKYKFDFNYFEKIDTEDKAYFLGLLYADGYHHEKDNAVILTLEEKDKDILDKFKEVLGLQKKTIIL